MHFPPAIADQRRGVVGGHSARDGSAIAGSWWSLLFVALVFGVLNASVRPLLKLLTLPLLILSLGLFTFVINALMLLAHELGLRDCSALGFHVAGFWAAFLGGLVVSIVSLLLSLVYRRAEGESACERSHEHFAAERCLSSSTVSCRFADQLQPAWQAGPPCFRTEARLPDVLSD